MQYTPNSNLKKMEYTDVVDVEVLNENFDSIDGLFETEKSDRQTAITTESQDRQAVESDLQTQINAMQGQTRRFFLDFDVVFGTDMLTYELAETWLSERDPALVPNVGTAFKNSNTSQSTYNHLFVFYTDPNDAGGLILTDDGVDTVDTASDISLGIVEGSDTIGIDINGKMFLKPDAATDDVIGERALDDAGQSNALVSPAAKPITQWLQGVRNNLKSLFLHAHTGTDGTSAINYQYINDAPAVITASDIVVQASSWVDDTTYEDYPYAALVSIQDVDATMIPEVNFGLTEASNGNFAPVSLSGNGTLTIYAAEIPESDITIASVSCLRGSGGLL